MEQSKSAIFTARRDDDWKDFGISTNHPIATAGANAVRLQGGNVFDMYLAALACAWVTDPANCSPFGRMQGIYSIAGTAGCVGAATRIRSDVSSTIPIPGNISAWFWFRQSGRLKLSFHDLLAPAIAVAQDGFTPSPALATAVNRSAPDLSHDLRSIYIDDTGRIRALVRNPALSRLLRNLADSTDEDQFWQIMRSGDAGPWRVGESLRNPIQEVPLRTLNIAGSSGEADRVSTTGNLETWGTWTLLGVAIGAELRKLEVLADFAQAMEAYVLSTILLFDRIPFVVGSLQPKVMSPSIEIDIELEARVIAERVVRLMNGSVDALWVELDKTYFGDPSIQTDDSNTNVFAVACGEDIMSFTTSIGPWFGSKQSWWGAALGYSYAMESRALFEGQTHDVTEMSPLILETPGRARLAIGAAGSERILGALTYLLFLKFGLRVCHDMARLVTLPRLFPKDGTIRVHRDFCHTARDHLEKRGFKLALADYDLERHLGIVNLVERPSTGRYRSATDPSGDGWAL
ncbi:gamma-glutamyltransferase [Rhizobium grahamii]|uniref:gamma-glutamyltransferase n=1 Tax=Rhizobium grahamii TaxID=1120045 RepID=UPI0011473D1A|nr:gamma-glutamyltransferase [Rhizobium grahamii]